MTANATGSRKSTAEIRAAPGIPSRFAENPTKTCIFLIFGYLASLSHLFLHKLLVLTHYIRKKSSREPLGPSGATFERKTEKNRENRETEKTEK